MTTARCWPVLTRHVHPVHGRVALAAHVAHVHVVGPDVVGQVGLPVHEGVAADVSFCGGQVHPALAVKSETVVQLVNSAASLRRIRNNVNVTIAKE